MGKLGYWRSTDRYAEAPAMERAYAEYWANKDGRTLERVTQNTCDGGKDFIGIEDGNTVYGEVKHWERPVDRSTLSKFIDKHGDKDLVFSSTNGYTDGALELAEEEGVETITGSDLDQSILSRVGSKAYHFAEEVANYGIKAVKRFRRLPLKKQLGMCLLAIVVTAAIWFTYKYLSDDDFKQKVNSYLSYISQRIGSGITLVNNFIKTIIIGLAIYSLYISWRKLSARDKILALVIGLVGGLIWSYFRDDSVKEWLDKHSPNRLSF